MSDNIAVTPGSGATAAADDVNGVLYQRVKLTLGGDGTSDGDVSKDNPIPVRIDQGNDPINVINGSMQVEVLGIEQSAEQINTAIAATGNDEPLQLVGLHPNYPLPIDTSTPMPIAGGDSTGAIRRLLLDDDGKLLTADKVSVIYMRPQPSPASFSGPFFWFNATGFQSVLIHQLNGFSGAPFYLQYSQDNVNWFTAQAYQLHGTTPALVSMDTNIQTSGLYALPVIAPYFRFGYNTTSSSSQLLCNIYLRRQPYNFINFGTQAVAGTMNLTSIAGTAVNAASAQLGVNAFGPTAAGSAHGANNPVQISGSDGANVRRILTDVNGNTQVIGTTALAGSLIPATANRAPVLVGAADLEQRARRMVVDGLGRLRVLTDESGTKDDGIVDALNNIVRELKLMNAKLTDLPYYLGINSVMPDDDKAFRDDPTLFNQ